jgi:signal transduction histidine kinase
MAAEMALDAIADDHPARSDVIEIRRSTARAVGLTDRLLEAGRADRHQPDAGQAGGGWTAGGTDVGVVVRAIEPVLRRLVEGDAVLVIDAPTGIGHVPLDPAAIESIVVNLVVNARDAQPFGGVIFVDVGDRPVPGTARPGVQLSVADTGTGIAADIRARIFEPFVTTKLHGSGLGLAIVADVARSIGGHVDAIDRADGGTVFRVVLPCVETGVEGTRPGPVCLAAPRSIEGAP